MALAPLVPGRASQVPHFSFSDTVQGKEMEEGPDLVSNSFNNHLLSMCSVPGAGDTVKNQTEVFELPVFPGMFNEWLHGILLSTYCLFSLNLFFRWQTF